MFRIDARRRPAARIGKRTVLFVHGSLSSGGMWKPYANALSGRYDVRTPDLTGYGAVPEWNATRPFRLGDEVARLDDAVSDVTEPVDIVAHSYGGLAALRFAWNNPARVRSLILFEPTCFRVLADADFGSPSEYAEITWVAATVRECVGLGAPEAAMCHFIDYWNGPGAWKSLPVDRQKRFSAQAASVARNFAADSGDDLPFAELRHFDVPTLVVAGARSTKAALVTSWTVASLLARSESLTVAHAGHMMPATHPRESLGLVAGWLAEGRVSLRIAA
jgi:pimeloyl-ACP methyl ester carboxylesterase